jgi:23S rRNA (guanine745-N1)-methyltransferase
VIADAVALLACPICRGGLQDAAAFLRCPNGHTFDVARQGYVNLLTGGSPGTADTSGMVAARARFLAAGHYEPIADVVGASAVSALGDAAVVDVGAGPGWYLARLLDRAGAAGGEPVGLALDLSVYAARRAARAHPRMAAAVCDTWRALPVHDCSAGVVVNMFAPRNPSELRRILRPGGLLVVVSATAAHLEELRDVLGLLSVEEGKERRLAQSLAGGFDLVTEHRPQFRMSLDREDVGALVAMGPSAWHDHDGGREGAIAELKEPVALTAAVRVATYRRRG